MSLFGILGLKLTLERGGVLITGSFTSWQLKYGLVMTFVGGFRSFKLILGEIYDEFLESYPKLDYEAFDNRLL